MKSITRIPTEHQEQAQFVRWFELSYPHIRFFAIPNGIRTSFSQAKKAKAEGLRAGVPDIYFPILKLWIEFKRSKGGVVSQEQKDWHNYLEDHCGDTVMIARGCNDGIEQINKFLTQFTKK
jgi:hypothetical protein